MQIEDNMVVIIKNLNHTIEFNETLVDMKSTTIVWQLF